MFTYDIKTLPFVSMTGRAFEKKGWSHTGRSMGVNLLTVIRRGECVFKINETEYQLHAGDAFLVLRDTYYKPHTDTFCEYTFFHFDGSFEAAEDDAGSRAQEDTAASFYGFMADRRTMLVLDSKMELGEGAKDIELLLGKCVNIRADGTGSKQILLSLYFSEILFRLSEGVQKGLSYKSSYPQSLSKILSYIKENYTSPIRLDDISAHTQISKQYCMRLFKEHMHTTINDYILELRMKHAAYLLRDTYMNVNEAADYLGFSSVSYFSRVFKKYFGVSPSEYSEQ